MEMVLVVLNKWRMGIVNFMFKVEVKYIQCSSNLLC